MTRARLVFAVLFAACACAQKPEPPRTTPAITERLFALARSSGERGDEVQARATLDSLVRAVRSTAAGDPRLTRRAALNAIVFEQAGFVREVDDKSLDFVLLPSVLAQKRGGCVGLGSLYLALGERLGWNVAGVMVPGHFFVRIEERDASRHNLELLRRGEDMPDAWYRMRFPIPGGSAHEYGRELTPGEVAGVIEYDVGHAHQRAGSLREARRAFAKACADFPDFAEAHASLGAVAHLLGALDDALTHYEAARKANPHLPGIDRNIALLAAERRENQRSLMSIF